MTQIVSIPKELAKKDLILIPRKDYERILTILNHYKELDKELKEATKEAKAGKLIGPFSSARELRVSLEK